LGNRTKRQAPVALNKPRPGQGVTKKNTKAQNNKPPRNNERKITQKSGTRKTQNARPGAQNKIQKNRNRNRNGNNRANVPDNLKIQIFNPKASARSNTPSPQTNTRTAPKKKFKPKGQQATNTDSKVDNESLQIMQEFVGVLKDFKEVIGPTLKQQQQSQQPQSKRPAAKRQRTVAFTGPDQEQHSQEAPRETNAGSKTLNDIFAAASKKGDGHTYTYL